jgi:hypothetical protein
MHPSIRLSCCFHSRNRATKDDLDDATQNQKRGARVVIASHLKRVVLKYVEMTRESWGFLTEVQQ